MVLKPTAEQLHVLLNFLSGCERAAEPPPQLVAKKIVGLLGVPFEYKAPLVPTILGAPAHAKTIQDVLAGKQAPFDANDELANTRLERVEQLDRWLGRFPAFTWLNRQPAIASSLATFTRIQHRRRGDPKFSDDLARFRFWAFSVYAVLFMNAKNKPPALSEERRQAVISAGVLLDLAKRTTVMKDAGIGYQEGNAFMVALEQLSSLKFIKRRSRTDAFTADRRYVQSLAWSAQHLFGDAPPALICEMAALKVSSPDKVSITKQVSDYKKELVM